MTGETRTVSEHTVAVVVPVYRGELTVDTLVQELSAYQSIQTTNDGHRFRLSEIILVHDCGPDRSADVIRSISHENPLVQAVWLSRNYGQHAATLAGMSSSSADWVVTMDEDGQHDPADIANMLDTAMAEQVPLVYADPTNSPPHSWFRNTTSHVAHALARRLSGKELQHFHSYRLVLGEVARGLAAYCGESVFLDVALAWVTPRSARCLVAMRTERDQRSAYSPRRLASHFWRLVLTSGTRPLRMVAFLGVVLGLVAVVVMGWVLWAKATSQVAVPGWTSVMVVILITSGAVLFSMGIVAEYMGIAVKGAMGKPLYLVVSDPNAGPLGRSPMIAPEADHEGVGQVSAVDSRT